MKTSLLKYTSAKKLMKLDQSSFFHLYIHVLMVLSLLLALRKIGIPVQVDVSTLEDLKLIKLPEG